MLGRTGRGHQPLLQFLDRRRLRQQPGLRRRAGRKGGMAGRWPRGRHRNRRQLFSCQRSARLRQLRLDDAHDVRACCPRRQASSRWSATPRSAAGRWSAFASRSRRWVRRSRSPMATLRWSCAAAALTGDRLHHANSQRPGQDGPALRRTAGRRHNDHPRKREDTRPWRTRAARLWRRR